MNISKLKGKIVEKDLNIEKLAEIIGINRASLYRKMSNAEKITCGEASKIADALELSDEEAIDIFLSKKSHDMRFMEN